MLSSTVTARRADDPGRWVRVTLAPQPTPADGRYLTRAAGYACRIAPADVAAGGYTPDDWESGLLSGLGYAWRRWFRPERGVALVVSELTGRLAHADMEGVAFAASTAAHELGGQPQPALAGWVVDAATLPTFPPAVAPVPAAV